MTRRTHRRTRHPPDRICGARHERSHVPAPKRVDAAATATRQCCRSKPTLRVVSWRAHPPLRHLCPAAGATTPLHTPTPLTATPRLTRRTTPSAAGRAPRIGANRQPGRVAGATPDCGGKLIDALARHPQCRSHVSMRKSTVDQRLSQRIVAQTGHDLELGRQLVEDDRVAGRSRECVLDRGR